MKRRWMIGAVLLALIAVPAFTGEGPSDAAGNNAFALKLLKELGGADGNLALSPAGVRAALAMTREGARGRTAKQMEEVLGLAREGDDDRPVVLPGVDEPGCELAFANSLWGQEGVVFRGEFLERLGRVWGAVLSTVDFRRPEAARERINAWVERKTDRNIRGLIEPGLLSADIQLVLANAAVFRGRWAQGFAGANTRDLPFRRADGEVRVPTMSARGVFGYRRSEGMEVLELPYEGDALSMVILLPRRVDGLAALTAALTREKLEESLRDLPRQKVAVLLPKFEVRTSVRLDEALKSMGMRDAFDGRNADFSGLTGRRGLRIFAVAHQTLVEVDEDGTVASGAGAVMVGRGGGVFRADRPFLFLIRERALGRILFLGRVEDPSESSREADEDED